MCDRICGTTIEEVQALSELKNIPPTEALAELRGRISMDDDVEEIEVWQGEYMGAPSPWHTQVIFKLNSEVEIGGRIVEHVCSCKDVR